MSTVILRGGVAGFAQEIEVGRHRLVADEPVVAGGTDTGPTPYDYLLLTKLQDRLPPVTVDEATRSRILERFETARQQTAKGLSPAAE